MSPRDWPDNYLIEQTIRHFENEPEEINEEDDEDDPVGD